MPTKNPSAKKSKKPASRSSKTASKKVSKKAAKTVPKARAAATDVPRAPRHEMIEKAAYYRAQRRNFENGDAIADWLSSEKEIDAVLTGHVD